MQPKIQIQTNACASSIQDKLKTTLYVVDVYIQYGICSVAAAYRNI